MSRPRASTPPHRPPPSHQPPDPIHTLKPEEPHSLQNPQITLEAFLDHLTVCAALDFAHTTKVQRRRLSVND